MRRATYTTEALIKEYTEHLRTTQPSLFPALTDIDINLICRYQFIMLHREIANGTFRPVRMMYLGVFKVFKSRAIGILNKYKKLYANHRVSEETLLEIQQVVDNCITNIENTTEDEADSLEESDNDEVFSS